MRSRRSIRFRPDRLRRLAGLCVAVAASAAHAEDRPAAPYGVAIGGFATRLLYGDAGPVIPPSETLYADTFGTGIGLRLEAFRRFSDVWRLQAGLVRSEWPGRHFTGGYFPAGAQFGDFDLGGAYVGVTAFTPRLGTLQPYLLGNLGAVRLSEVSVDHGGQTLPYWKARWRDYLELGVGLAYPVGPGAVTADLRVQVFGAPEPAQFPRGAATAGTGLLLGVGYEWRLGR